MKHLTTIIRLGFLGLFILFLAMNKPTLWLIFFVLSLLGALFFGRQYCGYMCPMNTVMIQTSKIGKRLKIQKKIKSPTHKHQIIPWIFLMMSLVTMVLGKRILQINIPILIIWIILSILVTIRFEEEFFHNQICPFGALQRLFSKKGRYSKIVNHDLCIGCKRCIGVCDAQAISMDSTNKKASIDIQWCHQCQACSQICPTEAIHYGKI